ncbi:MAG: CotH kinase family protein [Eubacterium sp.]
MKKGAKKILSAILSLALVFTSIGYSPAIAKAETTAELVADSAYNLALGKQVKIMPSKQEGGENTVVTDGDLTGSHVATTFGTTNTSYEIDLGNTYDAAGIDQIVSQYKENNTGDTPVKGYLIQYSTDGINYNTVKIVDGTDVQNACENNGCLDIQDVSGSTGNVRYVRLLYPDSYTWGIQVREIAVLDTDLNAQVVEVEKCDDAAAVTVSSDDFNTITYNVTADENQEDYVYNVYLDGTTLIGQGINAGQNYTVGGIAEGNHTVKVISVCNGKVSEGITSQTVEVQDISSLITGTKNITSTVNNVEAEIIRVSSFYSDTYTLETSQVAIDGKIPSGEGNEAALRTGAGQPAEIVIDLGQKYKTSEFDTVLLAYSNPRTYAADTTVSFSADNDEYVVVAENTGYVCKKDNAGTAEVNAFKLNKIEDYEETSVRYVKISLSGGVNAWGYVVNEIALALNVDVSAATIIQDVEVGEAAAVTAVSNTYNTIIATIEANTDHPEYKYNILVDGVRVLQNVEAGTYTIGDVEAGTHIVKVRAVDEYGNISPGIDSEPVTVAASWTYTSSTAKTDADRAFSDTKDNGNNYVRYTGVRATASSGNAKAAIDHNVATRWESAACDPQNIITNLGDIYSIKEIDICWETANAKDFTVEVSTDGEDYITVATVKGASADANRIDTIVLIDAVDARYIKINGTARNTVYGYSIWELAIYGPEADKEPETEEPEEPTTEAPTGTPEEPDETAPTNLYVENYGKYTGKYFVIFTPATSGKSYNVYVDNQLIKNVSGSGYYLTSEELENFENGNHTLSVRTVDSAGAELAAAAKEFVIEEKGNSDDIPQIYISTKGRAISGEYFKNRDGQTVDVNVAVVDNSGSYEDVIDAGSDIKVRGNTTAGGQKKPYNIKLNKKKSVLGMDSAKKWSLLANAFDKSLIRNALAMQMAHEVGLSYTSDCRFVDVYCNGQYLGNYLIIESVETGNGRIEINAEDTSSNDMLLELDNNGRDVSEAYHLDRTGLGVYLMLNEPEIEPDDTASIEAYQDKINYGKTLITNFETALKLDNYEGIARYIDVESFAKYYIVNEFFRNQDFNFSSTRFYIKDGKLYAGPCWDYDLSSGNIGNYYSGEYKNGVTYNSFKAQELKWYSYLMANETFRDYVISLYTQYQPLIKSLYSNGIDDMINAYGNSFERNYTSKRELGAGWSVTTADQADMYSYATNGQWKTYEESVEFLRDWLENRNIWLETQWGIDDPDMPASIINKDGDTIIRWNDNSDVTPDYYQITYSKFVSYSGTTPVVEKMTITADRTASSAVIEDLIAGNTTVRVEAVYEDETTNVVGTATAKADLKITEITLSKENPKAGETVQVLLKVENIGTAVAYPENDAITSILKIDGVQVNYTSLYKGPLNPNEVSKYNFPMNWTVKAGTHTIQAQIDERNKVSESNESNNISSVKFTFDTNVSRPQDVTVQLVNNVPYVTVTASEEQIQAGYTYDVYVDGEPVLTNQAAGTYQLGNITSGTHVVAVYSRFGQDTSIAVEKTLEVPELIVDHKVVAFEYDGTNAVVGSDMDEYADLEDSYTYLSTSGNGTMTASVNGISRKHIEWGDPSDYGRMVPVLAASKTNTWTEDAYVAYTFSTTGYTQLKASVDVGGTKKGPANLVVGYYEGDTFNAITTYTILKNKIMYTIDFDVPQQMENKDSVTIYVKLQNTVNIGGNEMTSDDYKSGGELAINNFVVNHTSGTAN